MRTEEKILETLLRIQELVESIADNQHRPNAVFYKPYSLPIPNWDNDNEGQKPFPEYWWTYTEGLPDVIKDWFIQNHPNLTKWEVWGEDVENVILFIHGHNTWFGFPSRHSECEYVTHQQIIDHYGLEEKGLPESWCIDIRVDDPRVEGFKEWINNEEIKLGNTPIVDNVYHCFGYDAIMARYDAWNINSSLRPQILTLDQFEELSGVNLMDYRKKEEVKIEVDESPFKVGDKVVIDQEYDADELLLDYLRDDIILTNEEYIVCDVAPGFYGQYGSGGIIKLIGKKWWHYAGNFKKVQESEVFTENEQPKKLYTKEEILEQYELWQDEDDFEDYFEEWIEKNM